ncbi:MAG: hypothetical protein OXI80_03630 [Caldilineaceae bacterium]|nr:hypothetical protein [Caldilineaceae bacterium]MDE0336738.1 hypothetical protein [Caldilineaceae bacterium]
MTSSMDRIAPLDSCLKKEFARPAHRLIEAWEKQHRFFHERRIQRDLFAEYEAITAWGTVTCCYSGIEQAMKCLLQMRGAYIHRPLKSGGHKHHHIGKLFQALACEEKDILRVSYGIYRSLHEYIPPETVDRFLDAIDSGYPTWRYFLLEGEMPPTTHPGTMLEIWSALCNILKARAFTNHGLYSVEQRIEHNLNEALEEAWGVHINTGISRREIDDLNRWRQTGHKKVAINAYADLFYQDTESSLDLIEVLSFTREMLNTMVGFAKDRWVDNDFAHFLGRAQIGDIVWNPNKNLFEKISRAEEIEIKLIESNHLYFEDFILGPFVNANFVESVPVYIEDFTFKPRVAAEIVDEDWSVEDEVERAKKGYEKRFPEVREYEGRTACEGYKCNVRGIELVIVLYDSKEWTAYRYHNEDVPGVPLYCKRVNGKVRSIREAIKAIEHWRRTEKKKVEAFRNSVWKRRGKKRSNARRGDGYGWPQ